MLCLLNEISVTMKPFIKHITIWSVFTYALFSAVTGSADDGSAVLNFTTQGQAIVRFGPIPSALTYRVEQTSALGEPFSQRTDGTLGIFQWTGTQPETADTGYFRISAQTIPGADLAAFNLLNRIAYGPTPDELERVQRLGPDAFIAEQLAAESLPDTTDTPVEFIPGWKHMSFTGQGTTAQNGAVTYLYVYLDGAGEAYVDDVRLVAGAADDGTQVNLVKNGDFEAALAGTWATTATTTNSSRNAEFVHSGAASLHLVDTDDTDGAGKTLGTSVSQTVTPALSTSQTYTVSFWYYTGDSPRNLIVRLGGWGTENRVALNPGKGGPAGLRAALDANTGTITTLRSWHLQKAIRSPRQLNEILRQFCENHFVTQYSKTFNYLDGKLPNGEAAQPATRTEYRENQRWAEALLKPNVSFLDLLKISAESPAMIVYLDTVGSTGAVDSKGKVTKIANENFGRELLELFTFGVDNGYNQQDIVQQSRAWTGWTIEFTAPGDEFNPFAKKSTAYIDPNAVTNKNNYTNLLGQWSFIFKSANHYTGPKYHFFESNPDGTLATNQMKTVPARFGAPWAGKTYGLQLPARTGTNGIQDGYDILAHLANQPFTQEYLCVKLCRLFVHDDFVHGYDFTDADTTPEEDLVHRMMLAWENPSEGGAKGQLRPVLKVLFASDLFRTSLGSAQKVKTPLEYAVSTVRALRANRGDGRFTADTDGTGLISVLKLAGQMQLFERAEPNGYPETAAPWISAGTLSERLRFVQSALIKPGDSGRGDAGSQTVIDPVGLLRLKNISVTDSGAVADYFLSVLFPTEGKANLAEYRALAVRFLNTANDGAAVSNLSSLSVTEADTRIRGAVSFLMTTARFQEQ